MVINKNNIQKTLLFIFIWLVLFLNCEHNTTSPNTTQTSVQFVFDVTNNNPEPSVFFQKLKTPQSVSTESGTSLFQYSAMNFHKGNVINGAKVLVLDMTQWASDTSFFEAWYGTGQYTLFDTTLWDSTLDFWNNISAMLKSYTGDYYQFRGEYDLTIEDSVARGTINVNPGLNYFMVCLRENEKTIFWDEVFQEVTEGSREENTIHVHATPAIFIEIYSPTDSAVYRQGQEIFFQAFAEDMLNYDDIPDSNYVWSSNVDGILGRGSYLIKSDLSVNTHNITLTVTTVTGVQGREEVRISVTP